jgi:hypothetical protein
MSADSYWAHQASGVRGALLRTLELSTEHGQQHEPAGMQLVESRLERLVKQGYSLLEKAAREYDRRR